MRNPHPSLTRLNREWSDLAEEAVPRSWRVEPALADLPDLGAVLAAVRPAPDEVLAALVRIGEPAAHRVVPAGPARPARAGRRARSAS